MQSSRDKRVEKRVALLVQVYSGRQTHETQG
jgi:hypothetical protein